MEGGWWIDPRVFDMLQYFETNSPLVESLWSSQQDEVYFIGGGTAGGLWRHQHNNGFIDYSTEKLWQQSFYMYLNQLIIDLYRFMTNSCLNSWFIDYRTMELPECGIKTDHLLDHCGIMQAVDWYRFEVARTILKLLQLLAWGKSVYLFLYNHCRHIAVI